MNILRVSGRNWRSYDSFDVSLPEGATAILGSNGAGKSSILLAIEVALFASRGELARYLKRGATSLRVEVDFEHAGESWRVIRDYDGSGRGKALVQLLRADSMRIEMIDASCATTTETDEKILRLVGVSRETLRASSLLMQGDSASWTEASPADRKRVLSDVLGLDMWQAIEARAKAALAAEIVWRDKAIARAENAEEIAAALPDAQAALKAAEEIADDWAERLAAGESLVERCTQIVADVRAENERIVAVSAEAERTRAEHRRVVDELAYSEARAGTLRDRLAQRERLQGEVATIPDARMQIKVHEALVADRDRVVAENREAQMALSVLLSRQEAAKVEHQRLTIAYVQAGSALDHANTGEPCPTCGQAVTGIAWEQVRASATAAHVAAKQALGLVEEQMERTADEGHTIPEVKPVPEVPSIDGATHRLERALAAEATIEGLARDQADLDELLGRLSSLTAEEQMTKHCADKAEAAMLQSRQEVGDVAAHEAELGERKLHVAHHREQLATAQAERVRWFERVSRAEEHATEAEDARTSVGLHEEQARIHALLAKAYGRDGVPALIVETTAVPMLELSANAMLDELGGEMRVELRTQRATKAGDLRDSLDIIVHTPTGEAAYESFSGGERTRLNLALRIALARLLCARRGADVRLLAIDEPDFLDVSGHEKLAVILKDLAQREFDRVLLITHESGLRDAFDQVINVERDEHGSRIAAVEGAIA